jgi:hypothetical protein
MGRKRLSPAAKLKTLPARYTGNPFAWNLDWRSPIGMRVMSSLLILADAIGGWDEISPQEQIYVSRVVYMDITIADYEEAKLLGKPTNMTPGEYSNHVNVQSGLVSKLGSQRRARPAHGVQAYLAKSARGGSSNG